MFILIINPKVNALTAYFTSAVSKFYKIESRLRLIITSIVITVKTHSSTHENQHEIKLGFLMFLLFGVFKALVTKYHDFK